MYTYLAGLLQHEAIGFCFAFGIEQFFRFCGDRRSPAWIMTSWIQHAARIKTISDFSSSHFSFLSFFFTFINFSISIYFSFLFLETADGLTRLPTFQIQ